ncbi:MAG: allophanate hydrolase [Leeuwenhoekiella sp.]|nr:MAG: allophanate hydrolase [Leeuwenhoekiella sp.]
MSEVEVLKPGLYTSIQDLGRMQSAVYGVPRSGVMDSLAARKANLLLNNPPDAAVLEITMTGPQLRFHADAQIVVCGATFELKLNDRPLEGSKAYSCVTGDVLTFGGLKRGFRAYLAINGGFRSPEILHSRSQYTGVTPKARIEKGDHLPFVAATTEKNSGARVQFPETGIYKNSIEAFPGPEWDLLEASVREQLTNGSFTLLPTSNRMAIGFKETVVNDLKGITTGPVIPGTVQLTPGGNLIALMRDCQVTGGYPRVLQLNELGICTLAQKRPGEVVGFGLKEYLETSS